MLGANMHALLKDPAALLDLAPEELGLVVLRDIAAQERTPGVGLPHRRNYSLGFQRAPDEVRKAIMEGWAWLEANGCIANTPEQDDGWVFVTRRGATLLAATDGRKLLREWGLPRTLLHPVITERVWSAFLRGEYDSAVFEAFKQVEVSIRAAANLSATDLGVALVRKAFDATTGPLSDLSAPHSEREALAHLFAGAIGSYKNPHSHRNVVIQDFTEASEMVILASHLLRIVDDRARRRADSATV